jgi:trehalose 6-phosphate phosphatase
MTHLLDRENESVLKQLAWAKVLLAFDFDGTLAPIVTDPAQAFMRPRTSELFAELCRLYPCAVISGRSKADVLSRLGDTALKYVIGNHGLEPGTRLDEFEHDIAQARAVLVGALEGVAGIVLEDKRYSLALHYRASRNKSVARRAIQKALALLTVPMRTVPGKLVVNVVPAAAPNKGDALLELRGKEHADTALYVGDDVTDEDVFRLDQPGRLLGVRVGESQASAATYFIREQREIDRLLARLVRLRSNRT